MFLFNWFIFTEDTGLLCISLDYSYIHIYSPVQYNLFAYFSTMGGETTVRRKCHLESGFPAPRRRRRLF